MNRIIVLSASFFFLVMPQAFAQINFYYYRGNKIMLQLQANYILVKYKESATEIQRDALCSYYSLAIVRNTIKSEVFYENPARNSLAVAYKLSAEDIVEYAAPVYSLPDDDGFFLMENTFCVSLKENTTSEELNQLNENYDVDIVKTRRDNYFLLRLNKCDRYNVMDLSSIYYDTGLFDASAPNFRRPLKAHTSDPNDDYYNQQWNLQKVQDTDAWDISKGSSSVVIAILDSGVDLDHYDLERTAAFSTGCSLTLSRPSGRTGNTWNFSAGPPA